MERRKQLFRGFTLSEIFCSPQYLKFEQRFKKDNNAIAFIHFVSDIYMAGWADHKDLIDSIHGK